MLLGQVGLPELQSSEPFLSASGLEATRLLAHVAATCLELPETELLAALLRFGNNNFVGLRAWDVSWPAALGRHG